MKKKEIIKKLEKLEEKNDKLFGYFWEKCIEKKALEQKYRELFTLYTNQSSNAHVPSITHIVHNKEKGTTVVWFNDGTKRIVKRLKGSKDCVYTAVAFALVEKLYGTNSAFQAEVDKCLK